MTPLDVFRRITLDGYHLILPDAVIDLPVQLEVDETLRAAGGVWTGRGYHFTVDPVFVLDSLTSGIEYQAEDPVVLSFGMGVESSAILLRWLEDESSRDFDLSQLIVVTAQTGDEFGDLGPLLQQHIIPRLVKAGVRWVQVARAGARQEDGVVVLEDSRSPSRAYLEGAYKLSQELFAAGTVPQVASGRRLCSLKAKGWPLDTWLADTMKGRPFRHVMGFNRDEMERVTRDNSYSTAQRSSEYPLITWDWTRQDCLDYIHQLTSAIWPKSCCYYCPFAYKVKSEGMKGHLDRFRADPEAGAQALLIEAVSLALNPRMTLYATRSLLSVLGAEEGMEGVWRAYDRLLDRHPWVIYRVQRIYYGKGRADRRIERIGASGGRLERESTLQSMGESFVFEAGYSRLYTLKRGPDYPTLEEFYVVAPALPVEKCRPGFMIKWNNLNQ